MPDIYAAWHRLSAVHRLVSRADHANRRAPRVLPPPRRWVGSGTSYSFGSGVADFVRGLRIGHAWRLAATDFSACASKRQWLGNASNCSGFFLVEAGMTSSA